MATLMIAEHDNTRAVRQTAKALTAAKELGGDVSCACRRQGCQTPRPRKPPSSTASQGASRRRCDAANRSPNRWRRSSCRSPTATTRFGAPATTSGKNIMPRVAALLDVMQISDIIEVDRADTFKRPIYAGNAIQTVRSTDAKKVITVRTAPPFDAAGDGGSASVETVAAAGDPGRVESSSPEMAESDRPELTSAKIIISGGRALGSKEKFQEVILPVADKLGAAVGASRAAVDAGYAPNDWQVGQTGKVVAPDLYIACGISGAIQHLAGMKDSQGHRRHQQG
jgi:electron transfer flavoprotein alpha subunit